MVKAIPPPSEPTAALEFKREIEKARKALKEAIRRLR